MKNKINLIARILVGALFIFSGAIKINDPIGTSIKFHEYFEVFSSDISPIFEIFIPFALSLAVIMSVLEVVIGFALLVNWRIKLTVWVLLGLMIFFTFLTFYSAYFNKVTDCGCFGDAIALTPWQSFSKDIILLIFIAPIFLFKKESIEKLGFSNIVVASSTVLSLLICIMTIRHLPFVDFRAYSIETSIPAAMQASEPLQYKYLMEKDGEIEEFTTYPTDPAYTFKKMEVMNPEAEPKITDFAVWNDEGDFTEKVFIGKKLLIIIFNADKAIQDFEAINKLVKDCETNGVTPWVLTATAEDKFEKFRHKVQLAAPYYYADATVLKTIIRSNPGLLLLEDGIVKGKWHVNDTPEIEEIKELL